MHFTTRRFRECYSRLPEFAQRTADKCYQLLRDNPAHPSLHFKKVGRFWSVRAGGDYRALGVEADNGIVWFWIGLHSEYERIIHVHQ